MTLAGLGAWLARRAENVVAAMLAAMFAAFMVQIVSRYVLNLPTGWTHEISVVLWIWLVLFGAAFVVRDAEEMRFDLIHGAAGPRLRRVLVGATSAAIVALLVLSLPGAWDYVTFMKVQKTAYLDIRFDALFSIYIVFVVAMIGRHLWLGWRALMGPAPAGRDPTQATSGV